jgi:2'-5' RNA ligase
VPEPAAASRRVFFALWPDEAALNVLDTLAQSAVEVCGGRRMRRDSLHLTLAFIGAVSPSQLALLLDAAARVHAAPFEMSLDRLGCWRHNHILWAGCHAEPSGQRRLFEAISKALLETGFHPEQRPYVSHITLVRNARCGEVLPAFTEPLRWKINKFTLVESILQPSGARYCVLAHWQL